MQIYYILSAVVLWTASCAQGDFAGDSGKASDGGNKPKTGKKYCIDSDCEGTGQTVGGAAPGENTTGETTAGANTPGGETSVVDPSIPTLIAGDGGLVVNVPLGRIEFSMEIDHVTDVVVTDTEVYAVHHELGNPKFGTFKLYDANGKELDLQGWQMNWGNCPINPTYDSNCASSKVTLKAGIKMNKIVNKLQGRGRLWKTSDAPFTVRITDCGVENCGNYGATGQKWSGASTYRWTME